MGSPVTVQSLTAKMPVVTGKPAKAKLIAALMASDERLIEKALSALEPTYGSVELSSSVFPFTYSDYYKHEMGDTLLKVFCSFGKLIEPDEIVGLKLTSIECEKNFLKEAAPETMSEGARERLPRAPKGDDCHISDIPERSAAEARVGRTVNIDPGYIDRMKLVLATTKDSSHRVYLGQGIYADVELIYRSGSFVCLEWTYPDYREKFAIEFFNTVRDAYLAQLKAGRTGVET